MNIRLILFIQIEVFIIFIENFSYGNDFEIRIRFLIEFNFYLKDLLNLDSTQIASVFFLHEVKSALIANATMSARHIYGIRGFIEANQANIKHWIALFIVFWWAICVGRLHFLFFCTCKTWRVKIHRIRGLQRLFQVLGLGRLSLRFFQKLIVLLPKVYYFEIFFVLFYFCQRLDDFLDLGAKFILILKCLKLWRTLHLTHLSKTEGFVLIIQLVAAF